MFGLKEKDLVEFKFVGWYEKRKRAERERRMKRGMKFFRVFLGCAI